MQRLGPPDYHPQNQTALAPEETLTREYAQSGYRDMVEGLEAREISLSQVQTFTKPVFIKCKEAIKKRFMAINESLAQKRKVMDIPITSNFFGTLWTVGLSQSHKRLRTLASQIPHGYTKKALFEVLIKNNVPILRATWFIKVNYLNQVRPGAFSTSGTPDKTQLSCSELWTDYTIDYLQYTLDELFSRFSSRSASHGRERSAIMYASSTHHKTGYQAAVEGFGKMQRYHGPSVTSAVNNNSIGGTPIRDTVSADSSSVSTNFQLSSRRSSQITPYKLKCDNDPLNTRLGPPDYHPQNQTSLAPEETLTQEYAQSGYRDMVEGLEAGQV
ncbi:hypothetical protein QQ045_007424 [Rhodiola kirilowii]